jgi:hypothetical protein
MPVRCRDMPVATPLALHQPPDLLPPHIPSAFFFSRRAADITPDATYHDRFSLLRLTWSLLLFTPIFIGCRHAAADITPCRRCRLLETLLSARLLLTYHYFPSYFMTDIYFRHVEPFST